MAAQMDNSLKKKAKVSNGETKKDRPSNKERI